MAEVRRVLITGGAGFIGSHYVRYAREHHPEWQIVVLDKLTYAGSLETLRDIADQIVFIRGDIARPEDVARAMIGVDAVVNFAAETHVDRSLLAPHAFVRTNVEGTVVLLEHARRAGVTRFLHVSTDEVYGDLSGTDQHSVETDTLEPRSPYAATKTGAEHLVFSYGTSYGLDVVVTRGSNTYGPYQHPEKIIPLFITNALEDRRLPVYGDGSAVRDYLHVEDHCRGIDLVLHRGRSGEAYNLGARLEISGLQVATQVLELLAKSVDLIEYVADRPGHDYRYSVDPTKAESLGWARAWAFPKGLARTVEWYVHTPGWWQPIKQSLDFQQHERKGSRNVTA